MKGGSGGRRSVWAILGVVVGAALVVAGAVYWGLRSGPKGEALAARERMLMALGERIAALRPGVPVLVLGNPFTRDAGVLEDKTRFDRAGVTGLRRGLGKGVPVTVVYPELRPEYYSAPASVIIPSDSRTPLSFLVRPESVDALAAAHPECGVIVSLIGLPVGVEGLGVWREEGRRGFALLLPDLRVLGSPEKAAEAFERGKILAAVVENGAGEAVVVTRENFEELREREPKALGL